MKDSLLLPVIFLLIFLVVFLLIAGLATLKSWGECFPEGNNTLVEAIFHNLPVRLLQILPVSILISLAALFIRILIKPGSRFLSFLFPLGTAFAVLIFGYYFLNEISPHSEKRAVKAERFLLPGKFTELGGYTVYTESLQDGEAANLILIEDKKSGIENERKKFNFYSRVEIKADAQGITLHPLNEKEVKINARPVYSFIFQEEPRLSSLFRDIGLLNAELDRQYHNSRTGFLILSFSLVFFCVASSVFMRISRWPLLNFIIVLLILRGIFSLFRFLKTEIILELNKVLADSPLIDSLPAMIFLFLGLVILFIDLVFVDYNFWQREIQGG
ncbi:MAG TPA: hypothetical protein ENI06_09310 [Spirochaetales bacterium]|nr:hypothetical protein [Spirochaetales bacterium]